MELKGKIGSILHPDQKSDALLIFNSGFESHMITACTFACEFRIQTNQINKHVNKLS